MPILLQISILIIVIVGAVHFVHKSAFDKGKAIGQEIAFEKGKAEGIAIGREQILEENIKRQELLVQRELDEYRSMEIH